MNTSPQNQHDQAASLEDVESKGRYLGYFQVMETALRELLVEKQILTEEEIAAEVAAMDRRTPEAGARVVAKAWTDPQFKQRLLENASAACEEMGIPVGGLMLVVVENTAEVHNVVVCTLCSCYPRMLLGLPPDWYKSQSYRKRTVREPRAVLAEFGTIIPESVEVRVHDSTADMRYMVLPRRPHGTDGMAEAELARLVTRDSMVGVSAALDPEPAS